MKRKVILSTALGFLFGIVCVISSFIFKPVGEPTLPGIIATIYNRTLIGLFIGLIDLDWKVRGILVGALVSWSMTIGYGLYGLLFGIPGII